MRSFMTLLSAALHGISRRLPAYHWIQRWRFKSSPEYWEQRYAQGGTSGPGSYGVNAIFKAEVINNFVREQKISSVVELGCGDGHQLSLAQYDNYIGLDVSRTAVERCRARFKHDDTKHFLVYEPHLFVPNRAVSAELGLSLDVIYHLVEDRIFEIYMQHLFTSATRFVIIYSTNLDAREVGPTDAHVKHRRFTTWIQANCPGWTPMNSDSKTCIRQTALGVLQSSFFFYKRPFEYYAARDLSVV